MTHKKEISYDKYLKFLGLCVLAQEYKIKFEEIEKASAELLKIEEEEYGGYGHLSDGLYELQIDPKNILKKLGIKIASKGKKK